MEMRVFNRGPDGGIDIRFEGLNGCEHVTSVKEALGLLQVENPTVTFIRKAEAGLYDNMAKEEYEKLLTIIETVSTLWQYKDEPEGSMRHDMNVLTLLANALERIDALTFWPPQS